MTDRVVLVIGAGAGIGGHVARRFARDGYHAVLCRRSDRAGLDALVADIEAEGGRATGRLLDATHDDAIESLVETVERDIGPVHVALYNLGAQIGNRPLEATSHKAFELGWRLGAFGLFRLAQALLPGMADRGEGCLLVTSATAAVRGSRGQHSHAAAMGARRMLCQTLNAEFAARGVHVAHIVVDSMVDAPDTLGHMLGKERWEAMRAEALARDALMSPAAIADTYHHIAHQPRSARTFELDLRVWSDTAWWNG